MTILFNSFRNCLFATLVAGLAMTNVTFAGHGQGNKGGGGKNYKSAGAKSMAAQHVAPPKKNFSAPKMVAKTPSMKSGGQSNFSNKQFAKTQTFKSTPNFGKVNTNKLGKTQTFKSSPTLGTLNKTPNLGIAKSSLGGQKLGNSSSLSKMKSSLNAGKLASKPLGKVNTSDLFKKVGKDSSKLGSAKKLSNSDLLSKVGMLDKSKLGQKLPSSPTNKIPNPKDPAGPFKAGGPLDKKNSKIGDILKDPSKVGSGKIDPSKIKDPGKVKDPGKINPGGGKIDPGKIKDPGKISDPPTKVDPGKVDPGKGTPTNPTNPTTPTTPTDPGMDHHDHDHNHHHHGSPWWAGVIPWGGWGGWNGGFGGGGGYGGGGSCGIGDGGYAEPAYAAPGQVAEAPLSQSYQGYAAAAQPAATPVDYSATGSVDLVLEDVRMIDRATVAAGPSYAVRFRNQGSDHAGKFRVAIFAALDGSLDDNAPRAVIEVPSLAAGEAREVALRLPASAMKLVSSNGSQGAFDQLLVLVDPDDAVAESDKANNVAGIDRADLETQVH